MFLIFLLLTASILLYINRGGSDEAHAQNSESFEDAQVSQSTHQESSEVEQSDYSDIVEFQDAFAQARSDLGSGHTFTWNGVTYKTDYKEWN